MTLVLRELPLRSCQVSRKHPGQRKNITGKKTNPYINNEYLQLDYHKIDVNVFIYIYIYILTPAQANYYLE